MQKQIISLCDLKTKWLLLPLVVSCQVGAWTQNKASQGAKKAVSQQVKPDNWSWKWATEKWTASDTPYLQIRHEVDKALAEKKLTPALLEKHRKTSQESPNDLHALFRWGYTLLKAPYAGIDLGDIAFRTYTPIVQAMDKAPAPRSYQFARLRFLLMTLRYNHAELRDVGLRLLRRDPKDYHVKFLVVQHLSGSRSAAQRQQALELAQEMVREQPKRASAHSILGYVFQRRLFLFGDLSAADKAIAGYQRFLELAPANQQKERAQAEHLIGIVEQEKARQQKEGFKPPVVVWR